MASSTAHIGDKDSIFSLLFIVYLFMIGTFITCIKASENYPRSQEYNRVIFLPGQPSTPSVSHFSGHITVNQDHGRALFFWFFEAQSQPSNKPLLLWLNGGPGCSSIGYGAAVELGPLTVKKDGAGLDFNYYSWNQEANLLFVESPVGVGFSYTNTSSDLTKLDDGFVAEDTYNFLVNWLQKFPQFKTHDFYISGESYAGHYIPQLAELVYDRNKQKSKYPHINLKGFIVGNPETHDAYDNKAILEYAWSHSVISDQQYDRAKQVCDFNLSNWSDECSEAMSIVFTQYREIDIYNIYAPKCLLDLHSSSLASTSSSGSSLTMAKSHGLKRMRLLGGYDQCSSTHAKEYFNRKDVQRAFHVGLNKNLTWTTCNNSILGAYNYTVSSVLSIYSKLVKGGLKIWMYSGDADGRVPVLGSRYCIEALGLPLKSSWRTWYHNHQVGGRLVEYEGLTFVTVRGAGHLVPLNKPSEALSLIHSFLSGEPLPTKR